METKYIKIEWPDLTLLAEPAEALRNGRLVAFPTETVYGLGANALDSTAVQSIYIAKGRPSDNPLIVHIADPAILDTLVTEIRPAVRKLMSAFWPGPLTMVLEKTACVPMVTTGGLDTVAVRMPDNPIALELIKKSGVPVAAPSANRSGKPSPTLAEHVTEDMNGRIAYIIDGGPCRVGVESTVLDMTGEIPTILRPGGITPEMIEQVVGCVQLDRSLTDKHNVVKPKAPGMKYTHYAPKGEVIVVSGQEKDVVQWICEHALQDQKMGIRFAIVTATEHIQRYSSDKTGNFDNLDSIHNMNTIGKINKMDSINSIDSIGAVIPYGSIHQPEEIASNIFKILRECDRMGVEKIYVEAIAKEGIGLAVMNRVEKAAGGKVIQLNT